MSEHQRFTRAARWLATTLAVSGSGGEYASWVIREGAQLGFREEILRAAFGEISGNVDRYGTASEYWTLDPIRRQLWMNWAAVNGVPSLNASRAAIAEFWKAPAATVNAPAPEPRAAKPTPYVGPPLSAGPELSRQYMEKCIAAKAELAAEDAPQSAAPALDTTAIFARRRREMGH